MNENKNQSEKENRNNESYKGENFDDIDGAWDWHSRLVPETVYSPYELEFIIGASVMFKKDFEESATVLIQRKATGFLDWINNNWFVPTEDSYWKLDVENIEYQRTIPEKDSDIFDAEELFKMFLNGEGQS